MASHLRRNGGSNTAVLEMEPVYLSPLPPRNKSADAISTTPPDQPSTRRASSDEENQDGGEEPPSTATDVKERWNYPRSNIPRVTSCFYSFLVMGANDSAYGVSSFFFFFFSYLLDEREKERKDVK